MEGQRHPEEAVAAGGGVEAAVEEKEALVEAAAGGGGEAAVEEKEALVEAAAADTSDSQMVGPPEHQGVAGRRSVLAEWAELGRGGEVAVLGLLLMVVVVVVILCYWPAKTHVEDTPVCGTPACLIAAAQMTQRMNWSADPCSDFRKYACGGWQGDEQQATRAQELADSYWGRLQRLVTTAAHPSNARTVAWKTKHFYESCMALDAIEADGDRPLRRILSELGGWHVLRDFSVLTWNYREQLVNLHSKYGASPFFRVFVVPDPVDPSHNIIKISPAGLGLPDRSYYYKPHDNRTEECYERYLQSAVQELGATTADARSFSEEVFHFEKRIAEVTPASSTLLDPLASYHKITIADLADKTQSIPLHDIISAKYPSARINDSTYVLAASVKYLTQISNIMTSSDREVLNNYMMWNFASMLLPYLSRTYRTVVEMFQEEFSGIKQFQPRWRMCVHTLRKYMGFALATLHDKKMSTKLKNEAKGVVNNMFETVSQIVKYHMKGDNFTDEFRQHAYNKVNAMALQVGYPAHMQTDSYLEEFYSDLFVQKNNFFQNILYGISFLQAAEQSRLVKPTENSGWMFAMANEDKVSYIEASNKVIVPQRLLVAPAFHSGYPLAMLYGSLGTEVAEAVASSVLPWGVLYQSDGTLATGSNMIANTTTQLVRSAEHCMAVLKSVTSSPHLADQGTALDFLVKMSALRTAYHAFLNAIRGLDHIHQPALEQLEDSARFFIAYAQSFCSKSASWKEHFGNLKTFQYVENKMLDFLVTNSEEFIETFRCKAGTVYFDTMKCKKPL